MRNFVPHTVLTSTALAGAALLLTACGSADDASTEANADTVEMPADEAMSAVSEEPVADPQAAETDAASSGADTEAVAAKATNVAAEAVAAAEAASE